jgi:hypothetical protein
MSRIVIVIVIDHRHKSIDIINLLGSQRRRNVFPERYGQAYISELNSKQNTGRWIVSRIVTVILIYHRHKPIDVINLLGSQRRGNVFPERYGQTYRVDCWVELNSKQKTGRWIMSRIVISYVNISLL